VAGEWTVSMDFLPKLAIANETLVFPLTRSPAQRSLSASELGELVVQYTRVGCWVQPGAGITSAALSPTAASLLTWVVIEFDHTSVSASVSGQEEAQGTCLTFRPPGGSWQPFLTPTTTTISSTSVRLEFAVPAASADAAAIYLPTYASISSVKYAIRAP
jgi:hypothetical protein